MNKLNTTKKGDKFEDKVFGLFTELLSNNELFIPNKFSKPFQKKPYYSKDREKNIITDISIETTLPNADRYSLLTIIECKGYPKNTVQVDEVEEFASKLSQIAGHNIKGIMVTSSKYAEGCITFARNRGIGLIRIIEDKIIHDIYRTSRFGEHQVFDNTTSIMQGIGTPQKTQYIIDNQSYDDISSYLIHLNIIDNRPPIEVLKLNVPFLSFDEIEEITNNLILGISDTIQPTNLNYIVQNYNLNLITDENLGFNDEKEILGKISFKDNSIYISSQLENDIHRWRFTLAHELGHHFLHTKLLSDKYCEAIDTDLSINNLAVIDNQSVKRIEYQANLFASSILMPATIFKAFTHVVFLQNNVNRGRLYLDNQICNQRLFYAVVSQLSEKFNVSIQAVKYRMIKLKLLEDTTGNSLRDLFNNY